MATRTTETGHIHVVRRHLYRSGHIQVGRSLRPDPNVITLFLHIKNEPHQQTQEEFDARQIRGRLMHGTLMQPSGAGSRAHSSDSVRYSRRGRITTKNEYGRDMDDK